jgi:hypothetical protein
VVNIEKQEGMELHNREKVNKDKTLAVKKTVL